jgi:transcriptional regulator
MPRRSPDANSARAAAADTDLGLLRGTLDLFVLKALSWGPMHGLAVLQWIERSTGQRLQIEEGALYPALHRMEDRGWLDAEWGHTEAGRRAKFYRLTAAGRRQLTTQLARWQRYAEAAAMLLNATSAEAGAGGAA